MIKTRITRRPLPTQADAMEGQIRSVVDNLQRVIDDAQLDLYRTWAEGLLAETDSITLLSAALKIMSREPDGTPVLLTEEKPARAKRPYNRGSNDGYKRPFKPSGPPRGGQKDRAAQSPDKPRQKDNRWV